MSYLINNEGKITDVKCLQASSIAVQQSTASYQDVDGSSISYTPTLGCDYVLYECTLFLGANDTTYGKFQFNYSDDGGSSWSTLDRSEVKNGSERFHLDLRWLFTISQLVPTWGNTERLFKLQFTRGGGSGTECDLHEFSFIGDSNANYYKPLVACSSITNSRS